MCLYQYKCECGNTFDAFRPMSQRQTATCACGKEAAKQLTVPHWTFGWRLSDESHIKGNKDKLVKNI